jgi:hypothetical protein
MVGNGNLHESVIEWACEYLSSHGYALNSSFPEKVQDTPWSYVARFATSKGYIYLKCTPKLLALEAAITKLLHNQFHAPVPEVIAQNTELNCFLMKDAGRPLREILKQQFDTKLLCNAIDQFTLMQLAIVNHINIFIEMGVPDWRLDKLPDLYKHLLSQKDILIEDGLLEVEINELEALLPTVSALCKKLSKYSIKQTLVQCDFHDNNILVDNISKKITIIDLGEIVISHPFFSLVGCMRQIKKHHGLAEDDERYLRLMNAGLKNYSNFEARESLLDIFTTAQILWFVYEVLAQYRLMLACGKAQLMSWQRGKLSNTLREFMDKCKVIRQD